jgi:AcrR family transcriptional regulator
MPRITDRRRAANRAAIIDAARRCFARDGFQRVTMPDLAEEAGISAGAFYRYFGSKDEVIHEIAREAFAGVGAAVVARMEQLEAPSTADVVDVLTGTLTAGSVTVGDHAIDLDVQARVAVQAWGEVTRNEELQGRSRQGLDELAGAIAAALTRGQRVGRVPASLCPDDGARLVLALLPGMILQRVVFGPDAAVAVGRAAAVLLGG